jgi:hypothetical protein
MVCAPEKDYKNSHCYDVISSFSDCCAVCRFLTSAKEDIGIDEAAKFLVQTILENDEVMAVHSSAEYQKGINIKNANAKNSSSGGCCA